VIKTLLDAIKIGTELLSQHQIEYPRLNAEILLSNLLGLKRIDLYLNHDQPMTDDEFAEYSELLKRRAEGTPVQYLTHWADFFFHRFLIEEGVFIPRRETEVLVEEVSSYLSGRVNATVLDIGTGCGNIAISLASSFLSASVTGIDICTQAVSVARRNAKLLGVANRINLLGGDLFQPISPHDYSADLIVSNPPYIKKSELQNLPPEVKAEPIHTYYGGEDGLQVICRIVCEGAEYLCRGGMMALEIGSGQAEAVRELMERSEYEDIHVVRDLSGNERVITARKGMG
jgi:release factor glutamine methyltransferase